MKAGSAMRCSFYETRWEKRGWKLTPKVWPEGELKRDTFRGDFLVH
jgi:hypothetical protein